MSASIIDSTSVEDPASSRRLATAAKIPGVRFQAMEGIGHFPFAENPVLFANYLLPILEELRG